MNTFATALHRIKAGHARLRATAIEPQGLVAPSHNPWIVLIGLVLVSLATMVYADYALGLWMQSFPEPLQPAAHWVTDLGRGIEVLVTTLAVLIAVLFLPIAKWKRRTVVRINAIAAGAGFVFISVAGGGLTALVLKYAIGRARPYLLESENFEAIRPFALDPNFAAFPSGHSATAGAMAMSLALLLPRWRGPIIALGVLICISRQLVGMHWPSDTLMGWGVGVAFTLFIAHYFARRRLVFVYDGDGLLRRRSLKAVSIGATARPVRSFFRSHRTP